MTYVYYFVHSKIFEKVYINTFQYINTCYLIYIIYENTFRIRRSQGHSTRGFTASDNFPLPN